MSVSWLIFTGCPNLPTTSNSPSSLYKPIVVTYGLKDDPVAKFANSPSDIDLFFLTEGFKVKLYSSSSTVQWYSFSKIK